MNIEKTITALKNNGYSVSFFNNSEEAVKYIEDSVRGRTVGFGGSKTLTDLKLQERLSENNTVYNPDFPSEGENFMSTAMKSIDSDCYFLSANGLSEDGVIVNLDATGNRLAGSVFGHKKIYYIIGTNKITENLEKTIWRVRNIAAPKNAMRFRLKTPCAAKGDRCYDCQSPERICNCLQIHLKKIDSAEVEVILINESLGF